MSDTAAAAVQHARKALTCLRLEADRSIADDVSKHVEAAFTALNERHETLREAAKEALEVYDACGAINWQRMSKLRAALDDDSEKPSLPFPESHRGYGG